MPVATAHSPLLKSFRAALLLTGSVSQAEEALARAIEAGEPDEGSENEIFRRTLQEAVSATGDSPLQSQQKPVPGMLPPELMRFLRLPVNLRRFFVLRILAGLSKKDCADLLHVSPQEVDAGLADAARELARLSSEMPESHDGVSPASPHGGP